MAWSAPGSADDELWSPTAGARGAHGAPPAAPPAPVTLAGYDGFTVLARGGASVVYRARQVALDRPVAVKVVHLTDPEAVRHFERELSITVRLGRQHPGIVTVLDTGVTGDGAPCLVMELADLGSLDDRLRAVGPLPVAEAVAAGTVIADALAFAHAQGVVHRDVKPQNILVLPTSYVLADFGIARGLDAGHSASLEVFSYRHAAPQVLDGEVPVASDDVYSLGSTLWTLLEARAPFSGATAEEDSGLAYLRRARTQSAPRLPRSDAPEELRDLVASCLAPDRADRPTAVGLRAALAALPTELRGWDPAAVPASPAPRAAPEPETTPPVAPTPVVALPAPDPEPAPPPLDTRLAVSALAHLPPRGPADDGATGLPPAEEVVVPVVAPRGRSRARTRALYAGVGALAAGAVAVGSVLAADALHGDPQAAPAPAPSTGAATAPPVVAPTTAPPSTPSATSASSPSPTVPAAARPRILTVRRTATGTYLHWADTSGGTAQFVVVQVLDGDRPSTLGQTPRGITQLTVTPTGTGRPCFAVLAVVPGQTPTTSDQVCRS